MGRSVRGLRGIRVLARLRKTRMSTPGVWNTSFSPFARLCVMGFRISLLKVLHVGRIRRPGMLALEWW